MLTLIIYLILTIAGVSVASYLFYKRKYKQPLACPIDHDCNVVVDSKWSKTLFLKNDLLGILYYILLFALGILHFLVNLGIYIKLITLIGLLFSVYLTYVQKFKLKEFCFYCLISALISLLLFVTALFL